MSNPDLLWHQFPVPTHQFVLGLLMEVFQPINVNADLLSLVLVVNSKCATTRFTLIQQSVHLVEDVLNLKFVSAILVTMEHIVLSLIALVY